MTDRSNNNTFLKITNSDIYKLILDNHKTNEEQHKEILSHQKFTNGKVKLNGFVSKLSLSLVITVILGIAGLKLVGVI